MAENNNRLLHPILSESSTLAAEYRKRKKTFITKAVSRKRVESYLEKGWEYDRRLKKTTRLKMAKSIDEQLENKVWCLFHDMGYPEMNEGRSFKVKFQRGGKIYDEKQIDVFAKDDETVVVAECKASETLKVRRLQNDIEAFANKKTYIANAVKKYYGPEFKPKILWLFVTENIRWSPKDRKRAESERIHIIADREFRYFNELVKHLGSAGKYQFLAEFFKDQEIPGLKNQIVPAIRGKLGGKYFYSFVTTPKQLLKIAFVNHRALDDPEGYPTYQRLVEKSRLKRIGSFLEEGGFFPTNFLINFTKRLRFDPIHKDIENDIHYGQLYLPAKYKSAWIIDGQHRLYGYSGLDEKYLKQNIMVIAFEKIPRAEEANLFVTINHEQKSVPRSLLDDLEGDLKWESEKPNERIGAISSRLVKMLNADLGEPIYNRVTAQGIRATDQICLTVPELKDGIKRSGLVGTVIMKNKIYSPGPLCDENDEKTLKRAREAINLFLTLIKDANPDRWEKGRPGYLCTNPGIRGYLMLLAALINYMENEKKLDARELDSVDLIGEIEEYLEPITVFVSAASDAEFEKMFKVKYGSGGQTQYYYHLCQMIHDETPSFCPDGFDDWKQSQSKERIKWADGIVKELQKIIPEYIFSKFKEIYGEMDYLEKGVKDINLRAEAYKRQQADDPLIRADLEAYFEFIQLKEIIKTKQNWQHFKDVFNIPLPDGKKDKHQSLEWMERINVLRRVPGHGYQRNYRVEDFKFLEWIYEEFKKRRRLSDLKQAEMFSESKDANKENERALVS